MQEFIDGHDLTEELIPEKRLTEEQTLTPKPSPEGEGSNLQLWKNF